MGAPQGGLWHAHLTLLQVTIIIIITLLICLSSRLLVVKLDFHQRTPDFPGNLAVDKETLIKIGNNDAGQFYELCIEFLDYMDEILALQKGVFSSLDMSKANSMTMGGQCRLAPLIVCIQDSVHLYDYTVKLLFLLHQHLPPDTLSGHAHWPMRGRGTSTSSLASLRLPSSAWPGRKTCEQVLSRGFT